jgi:(E)-4-hydroxy-3-methylbut-2-enyl-diphosphate synthase
MTAEEYLTFVMLPDQIKFISVDIHSLNDLLNKKLSGDSTAVLIINTANLHGMAEQRRLFMELQEKNIACPVIIQRKYDNINSDQLRLYSATDIGSLLIDGFGDGASILFNDVSEIKNSSQTYMRKFIKEESREKVINRLLFGILQAARVRISKTEYIACPSCGRTLFDLQETTEMIRKRTEHLKGVKIAIMGCIVNGPGEMADADYGYVGSGPGKITLYKGKDIMQRNVPFENAVDSLIEIIKEDEKWVEPV